jgi:hypothetical protein
MKTIVFIFVPIARVEDFSERLSDRLASLPDSAAPIKIATSERNGADPYPFWTWFLPNPLWEPKERP